MTVTLANEGLAIIILFVGSVSAIAGYFLGIERNCDRDSARAGVESYRNGYEAGYHAGKLDGEIEGQS